MKNPTDIAYRFRWVLLFIAVLFVAALFAWLLLVGDELGAVLVPLNFFMFWWGDVDSDFWPNQAYNLAFWLGVLLLVAWMFLRPKRNWTVHLADTGRPMKSAVAAAAIMGMLLTAGLGFTLLEVWDPIPGSEYEPGWLNRLAEFPVWIGSMVALAVVWAIWAVVFFVYWRRGARYTQLQKMINGLLAGSILQQMIAIGVFVWNPNEDDCWCARGSYFGLVFGATVMIWAFGPGLLLLFLRQKHIKAVERQARSSAS